MSLTHLYTIMCDDVRTENNGKLIVIGVYTPNIGVPMLPMGFGKLSFVVAFTSDIVARHQMRAQIRHLETGHVLGELMGMITHATPGFGIGVLQFPNVIVTQAGRYNLILNIEGRTDPLVHDFEVILQMAQQLPAQALL